jgi:hypothetical protein
VCIGQRSPRATAANTARLRDWPQAPELAGRLVCIKGFAITGDFQPDDPVCVHPDNRVEDERCENNDALCGEGMICSFSGTCVVRECNVDEDCAEGPRLPPPRSQACPSACAPPPGLGEACFVFACDEGDCGLEVTCSTGLEYVNDFCAPAGSEGEGE